MDKQKCTIFHWFAMKSDGNFKHTSDYYWILCCIKLTLLQGLRVF